jgi:hypothetical protein
MQEGGCDLYEWYEGPWDPFVQNLLVDLRDAVWDLKRERAILQNVLSDTVMKLEQQKETEKALRKLEQSKREATATQLKEKKGRVCKLRFCGCCCSCNWGCGNVLSSVNCIV